MSDTPAFPTAPVITRRGWIRIAVVTLVGLAVLPFTPGVRQQWNLRLAAAHAAKLRPLLRADVRFRHIQVNPHTGALGSLIVMGELEHAEDKAALCKLVLDSHPPVHVSFVILKPTRPGTAPANSSIHADGN